MQANFAAHRDELLREITEICDSGMYILGPKVAAFESSLAAYTGAKHALGLSSGTDALLLAMMALDIGAGDEVIVPTFTFFATAGCVSRLGATPVFVDVCEDTFNMDVSQIESRITPRTKAIIPVHLYGLMADMRAIEALVARYASRQSGGGNTPTTRGIAIIEDAAQAIGSYESEHVASGPRTGRASPDDSRPRHAGTIGEFGCLSFYPTKNLGALGDAGALLTNDEALAQKARLLRTHGENPKYFHHMIGANFRLDALQAGILRIKLQYLESLTERRRERAARYCTLFEQAGLAPEFVRLPIERGSRHVYHQFVIRVPMWKNPDWRDGDDAMRRDDLISHLHARQIGSGIYYPVPLHMQKCFAHLGGKTRDFPVSERLAAEVLALPIYAELTDAQQEAVVRAVAEFFYGAK